ncbi:hypothetical protein P154DRAFT_252261 [Amniculicola lignicola CBS 123094]|uniref:Uncharacterized protein n=1 Tax=Amniculicola lignicola CBS 123094 TaxID=1392246 RepID=A0A6A5W929_9PLEO|nr:hypothetical protein P154DRAFT_252261 [Amniculicola lignicola CBS 123094]
MLSQVMSCRSLLCCQYCNMEKRMVKDSSREHRVNKSDRLSFRSYVVALDKEGFEKTTPSDSVLLMHSVRLGSSKTVLNNRGIWMAISVTTTFLYRADNSAGSDADRTSLHVFEKLFKSCGDKYKMIAFLSSVGMPMRAAFECAIFFVLDRAVLYSTFSSLIEHDSLHSKPIIRDKICIYLSFFL